MFVKTNRKIDTLPVALIARSGTKDRLAGKCFRRTQEPLAGNFFTARSIPELLSLDGSRALKELADTIVQTYYGEDGGPGTFSSTVAFDGPVGWASTAPLEQIDAGDLEDFDLNRGSWGKRARLGAGLIAPKTNLVTFVYEVRREDQQVAVIIHSVYPGPDIGELKGDVSAREKVAFFDWNHPGEA
jgi:hypothetical protein